MSDKQHYRVDAIPHYLLIFNRSRIMSLTTLKLKAEIISLKSRLAIKEKKDEVERQLQQLLDALQQENDEMDNQYRGKVRSTLEEIKNTFQEQQEKAMKELDILLHSLDEKIHQSEQHS